MTLTLLLILSALEAPDQARLGRQAVGPVQSSAVPAQADRPSRTFRVEPLQLGPAHVRLFPLGLPTRGVPVLTLPNPGETQLANRATGVTCTMHIVTTGSSVDRGILAAMPQTQDHLDQLVRNDLSPCVE